MGQGHGQGHGQGQGQGQARTEVAGALQLRHEERMSVCLARPCCSSCLLSLVFRHRLQYMSSL